MVNHWNILNETEIGKKTIYILSTDVNAKKIFFFLLQHKMNVQGFVVKEKCNVNKLYSLPVFLIDETEDKDFIYVVDAANWNSFHNSVDEKKVYIVESDYFEEIEFNFIEKGQVRKCNAALMITMILSRVPNRKPVFLVKLEDYDFWLNLVSVLKDEIKDPVIITIDAEIEKIYELIDMDLEKLIIFVSVFEKKEVEEITEILTSFGLAQTQHFLYIYNSFSGHITEKYYGFDWFLGNTCRQEQEFPGFYVHGDKNQALKKIVLLGNSASDPLFYPQKSWPEMLWEECNKSGVGIMIYNGAITDYNSTNEVIKLFRDVLLLEPDIVISYSGIIDFRQYVPDYPYLNLNLMRTSSKWEKDNKKEVIYGIRDNRSAYERWLSNEKIMYKICNMYKISFYGVLQPWLGSECTDAGKKLQVWSEHYWQVSFPQFDKYVYNSREFKEKIQIDTKDNEWLYDFTNIFADIEDSDIYFDSIHVNEYGNQIVANLFKELLDL